MPFPLQPLTSIRRLIFKFNFLKSHDGVTCHTEINHFLINLTKTFSYHILINWIWFSINWSFYDNFFYFIFLLRYLWWWVILISCLLFYLILFLNRFFKWQRSDFLITRQFCSFFNPTSLFKAAFRLLSCLQVFAAWIFYSFLWADFWRCMLFSWTLLVRWMLFSIFV